MNELRIQTHIAASVTQGNKCKACGLSLPPPIEKGQATVIRPGEHIAVIETVCIPPSSYRPGENDSNTLCAS